MCTCKATKGYLTTEVLEKARLSDVLITQGRRQPLEVEKAGIFFL